MRASIESGAVRPFIGVAIDAPDLQTRIRDYLPPGDRYLGIEGGADRYARFVIEELKPALDAEYATLVGREDTATAGFSFGGLAAFYLGSRNPECFGGVGSLSGGFWASDLTALLASAPASSLRIYLDSGDDNYAENLVLRDALLARGYAEGRDLCYVHREGHTHHPRHFAVGFSSLLRFLFPPI